jgi:nitrite reductase (NADH) small subunit
MPFVKVARLSDVPPDSVIEVTVAENPYAICNAGGSIYALNGICLHRGGPVGQGQIHAGRVICPWHAWEFDCRTGQSVFDSSKRLATYEVKVEGEDILLLVP